MQRPWRIALLGALIAAVLTLPGLGTGTLWDNSETAYGEVAREILLFHDGVVMHLNGAPWFVQPPLYFWVAALFGKVFGVGSLAFRLPSALATIAMSAMTGYAVTRAAGARAGAFAAIILSTSLMQAIVGRLAIMDALLDLTIALTIFWWYRGLQTGADKYFIWGWIAAAFGCLAKGPVALAAALLVIVPFYVWNRRAAATFAPSLRATALGLGAFALIVAPWFSALAARAGGAALAQMIGHYTFGRYTGTIENQGGALWYYVPVLVIALFPWVAFLPAALLYAANQLRAQPPDDDVRPLLRLAVVWVVLPLAFFSLAKTKLPNYIALELPGLALLIALYFDSVVKRYRRRSLLISAAAIPITIGLIAAAIVIFSHENRLGAGAHQLAGDLLAVGAMIFAGSVLATVMFMSARTVVAGPVALGAGATLSIFILAVFALPVAERFKPVPRLASIIQAQRRAGDAVAIQGVPGGNALVFYTQPGVQTLAAADVPHPVELQNPRTVICRAARTFVVTSKRRPRFDPTFGRERTLVASDNNDILLRYDGPPCK
ncbi:MAG: hypothetical protein DLM50_01325 [Candidatus Meridianibacter frigidus]|nr:MAG: hypothetical protein DLM50_01325 [Candidatus Eremiobacteraeota bacterium]